MSELPRPPRSRWTSFIADVSPEGRKSRGLHEDGNAKHRARVEHDRNTVLVHLSDEDGHDWICLAVDRATRGHAVGHGDTQRVATVAAYDQLYTSEAR